MPFDRPDSRRVSLACAAAAVWLAAWSPPPAQQRQEPSDEAARPTFRAVSDLVTVDAVVTDADGRHVTDLTLHDFEVLHGGEPQSVRHAVYVPLVAAAAPTGTAVEPDAATALGRAVAARPARIARTIAVVVDDLGLSFESTANVRRALRRFVDEQVQPGDLVAVLRTSGGIGALQQFTMDRRLLREAVDRIRWTVVSRSGVTAFAPVQQREPYTDPTRKDLQEGGRSRRERAIGSAYAEDFSLDAVRQNVLAAGSLGALEFVVRGVQGLPGRKAVVFVSEGFELFNRTGDVKVWKAFTRLMDHANRAGVVVYTMDGRGLETGHLVAEDNPQLGTAMPGSGTGGDFPFRELIIGAQTTRQTLMHNTEEALHYIAWQTGGFAILNTNDLAAGLGRVLADLRGYYLLGYDLPPGSPRDWDPDRVRVRVKREGLEVRSRRGYFGPAGPAAAVEPGGDPLVMAATSPFGAAALTVRLTSLFGYDVARGAYVRSLLFIDPGAVTFREADDGRHHAELDVLQLAVGDNGALVGEGRRTVTLRLTDDQLRDARTRGIVYSTRMTVGEPGAYQIRIAVLDRATSRVGSASQFLLVPPVGKGRLAVSGVLLQGRTGDVTASGVAAAELGADSDETVAAGVLGAPSLRIFRPGSEVVYAYEIYDGLVREHVVEMGAALLRGERVLYRSPPTPVRAAPARGGLRIIPIAGLLSLGDDVPPGSYTLEVSLHSGTKRLAAGWVDLEVRK